MGNNDFQQDKAKRNGLPVLFWAESDIIKVIFWKKEKPNG
jgi:hypothetical protein